MRVLLNILIYLIAWPVLAYDWQGAPGWGDGYVELRDAFYPPLSASPRAYDASTNVYFAKDVWAQDIANALHERAYWAGVDLQTNTYWGTDGFSVRWEHEHLEGLKSYAKEIITRYISLTNRSDAGAGYSGNYTAWYAQFDIIDPATGTNYVYSLDYASTVINPPNWTIEGFFEWSGLPTNYFEYTPARFLGATSVGFTNQHTAAGGGTNEWTTLDYGWEGMLAALKACQDLFLAEKSGVVRKEYGQEFDDLECGTSLPAGNWRCDPDIPTPSLTNVLGDASYISINYNATILGETIDPGAWYGAKWTINSEHGTYHRGIDSTGRYTEQIETLQENATFQWYEFLHSAKYLDRITNEVVEWVGNVSPPEQTNVMSVLAPWSLAQEVSAPALDENSEVVQGVGVYTTSSSRPRPASSFVCPGTGWAPIDDSPGAGGDHDLYDCWEGDPDSDPGIEIYHYSYSVSSATLNYAPRVVWRPQMIYAVGYLPD